jgi:hypothetical protein
MRNARRRWPHSIDLDVWFGVRSGVAGVMARAKLAFAWNRPGWYPVSGGSTRWGPSAPGLPIHNGNASQGVHAVLAEVGVQHDRSAEAHATTHAARLPEGSRP